MERTVVICDRCDTRIANEREDLSLVRVSRGDTVISRDVCPLCRADLELFLRGVPLHAPDPIPAVAAVDETLLVEARRTAREGLERYADGASAHELAERLRDVQSAARRR